MRHIKTMHTKIEQQISRLEGKLNDMRQRQKEEEDALNAYINRHKSLAFDGLETTDVSKMKQVYAYFDEKYPIEWQGGLRSDSRGMRLCWWVDGDPDYLNFHFASISNHICFSGSTSWIAKAKTLKDKKALIRQVKKDIQKILK